MAVDYDRARAATHELLEAIGAPLEQPDLADTPDRVARWWQEFIDHDPGNVDTTFDVEHADQMVTVSGIDTWSLCAHHLLPFSATVTVAYLPTHQVLGLSKFARVAHHRAHALNTQEGMVANIADDLEKLTGCPDVAVVASGTHLCMAARGVRTPATMTTSVLRGRFRDDQATRAEFFALTGRQG